MHVAPMTDLHLATGQFPNRQLAGSSVGKPVTLLEGSPLSPVQGGPRKGRGELSTGMNCSPGKNNPALREG